MDPGWFFLFIFFLAELLLVTLLCLPMPSNDARGAIVGWVVSLWESRQVRLTSIIMLAINLIYFWFVSDAILHPLYDFGLLRNPFAEGGLSCEAKQNMFYNERNAYLCGMSIFLFFILNRLVDVQHKLFVFRGEVKRNLAASAENGNGDGPLESKKEK